MGYDGIPAAAHAFQPRAQDRLKRIELRIVQSTEMIQSLPSILILVGIHTTQVFQRFTGLLDLARRIFSLIKQRQRQSR